MSSVQLNHTGAQIDDAVDKAFGAVRFDESQELSSAQKSRARSNIGASLSRVASLTLPAALWRASGSSFAQSIAIPGATANSKVDLQPDATVIAQMIADNVAAMYIANTSGTLTVYAIGGKPSASLTVQVTMSEVET